jgi:hypothetical protein
MSATPNLSLPHIHANQSQKEVTANQFADGLDTAIAGSIIIDLTNKAEYLLTTVEARHAILVFKGVLTAPATIIIPTESANKKFIIAHHADSNFPIYLQHPNTQSIDLQPGERCWIFSDGQQLYGVSATMLCAQHAE